MEKCPQYQDHTEIAIYSWIILKLLFRTNHGCVGIFGNLLFMKDHGELNIVGIVQKLLLWRYDGDIRTILKHIFMVNHTEITFQDKSWLCRNLRKIDIHEISWWIEYWRNRSEIASMKKWRQCHNHTEIDIYGWIILK